ncbi:MAG TPA: secretin N-terminal domain-containing protein, partial [Humisphaera sp.]
FIYRLRNGQAARMEQVLNVLFGNVQPGQGQNGRLGANDLLGGGRTGTTASRLGTGTGRSRSSRGGTTFGNDGLDARALGLDGRGNRGQLAAQQQLSQASSRVVTELTGQVLVVADEDTNSLLVTTGTKYLDQVKQVIAELDRPVPQVLIKVLVAEVTHDDGVDFGVDFSILNQRPSGLGQTGGTSFGLSGADAATGGLVVQLLESRVNATLRALATKGKLEVLSRPYILASDNQLASITVGQEVPFITNTRITDNGQQINTIEYQDVGIILSVTPHINPDGLVIMDVIPEISQLTSSTVPISAGVTAPVIAKRSATSRVGIRTGNTIVIGGLMEDRKTVTVLKVPLLGDIPLIGPLFARTRMDKTKTELLIFLTPVVATQPDALVPMTGDEAAGTALVPNAISPGMFDRHLDGMQRGSGATTQPAPGAPTTLPQTQGLELPIRPQHVGPVTPATQPAGGGR